MLRKLVEFYPQEAAFRGLLIKYLIAQKGRENDAEKELRHWATANPTDVEIGLTLVRFLRSVKGPDCWSAGACEPDQRNCASV